MNPTTAQTAQEFAAKWLDAWNGHDIEAILSHYADDIVFLSPLAHQRVGNGQVI
jgi:ketosteroid isomerase-like protein